MKIVLLMDIAGVGRRNEIKNVSDGYALNMLFPQKLAVQGTPSAVASAAQRKVEQEAEQKIQEDLLFKNLSSMEGITIWLSGKANDKGHLFASIHAEAIIDAMKKQKGVDLLPEFLQLDKPIKEVGEHKIAVDVHGKKGGFTLVVKAA